MTTSDLYLWSAVVVGLIQYVLQPVDPLRRRLGIAALLLAAVGLAMHLGHLAT